MTEDMQEAFKFFKAKIYYTSNNFFQREFCSTESFVCRYGYWKGERGINSLFLDVGAVFFFSVVYFAVKSVVQDASKKDLYITNK